MGGYRPSRPLRCKISRWSLHACRYATSRASIMRSARQSRPARGRDREGAGGSGGGKRYRHRLCRYLYRERVEQLTAVFPDDALKAQAFERIRSLIDTVVLKQENGILAIHLRGELASMISLCAGAETQKASAVASEEALQIKMVAGTGFEPVTFRL